MVAKHQNLEEMVEKGKAARREFLSKCLPIVFPKSMKELTVSTVFGPQSTFAEYKHSRSPYDEEVREMRENYLKTEQALEERAKQMLRAVKSGKTLKYSPEELGATMDALNFLEEKNYLKLTGGTPKSGAQYKITKRGEAYL